MTDAAHQLPPPVAPLAHSALLPDTSITTSSTHCNRHDSLHIQTQSAEPEHLTTGPALTCRTHSAPQLDGSPTHSSDPSTRDEVIDPIQNINFDFIRDWCAIDKPTELTVSPCDLAEHRRATWPEMSPNMPTNLKYIYQAVKHTGLPNCMSARVPLVTGVNVQAWRDLADGSPQEDELIDFIEFGFPLGYNGPASHTLTPENHKSALDYPTHITEFICQEREHAALFPSMEGPIFLQWQHTSPMMTRPKADPQKRRIITDLSFPQEASVNAYIKKNCSMGRNQDHSLPTVQAVVDEIKRVGPAATLFTVDVHRVYKNFRACPLDWPLLNLVWPDEEGNQVHYLDITMPFGSKLSSLYFQRAANFIIRVLHTKGVKAFMYLDDLIVVAPDPITAYHQFDTVRDLLKVLGLPEAPGKTQPPSHTVTFLGIVINVRDMTLSIPDKKVQQTLQEVRKTLRRRTITRRHLQSIIGRIVHVAKCVPPARLFAARLLETLRGPYATNYTVDCAVRADLRWFVQYLRDWNGTSYIPVDQVSTTLFTDACMKGIGATDGCKAYAAALAPHTSNAYHITEIEALNVLLACDAFLTVNNAGSTVRVRCDNNPAVQVFATGRGHNHLLLDIARRLWLLQAKLHIKIIFHRIPGVENVEADILSRAFNGPGQYQQAMSLIQEKSYDMCIPNPNIVNKVCSL